MVNSETGRHKVTFLPDEIEVTVEEGHSIMEAAARAGILLDGPCGGKGTCKKCTVLLEEKDETKPVLACKSLVKESITVTISVPEVSLFRKGEGEKANNDGIIINPGIWKKTHDVIQPNQSNQYPDLTRLYQALGKELKLSYTALKALPHVLRKESHKVTVTYSDTQVLSVEPGDTENQFFGLAIDIGTTTVVVSLVNLRTAEILGTASTTNAQNIFGADVISRIEHVSNHPEGLEQLQKRIIFAINNLIDELCSKNGISELNIYSVVIAGNTTMEHLFLGIDPRYLAMAPFIPVITHALDFEAYQIGMSVNPHAKVSLISNIAAYVGGDTTSVILSTEIYKKTGIYLVVDIGTNGEIVLSVDGKMYTCSTAAGPAFEGAHIKFGMRAVPGAIEGVYLDPDISLKVIGDVPPTGICGSGLLQAVELLVLSGVVAPSGKMLSTKEGQDKGLPVSIIERLGSDEEGNYFILSPTSSKTNAILITQKDVRELQLAKGAMRTGIEILLIEAGVKAAEIDQILLAGAFGNYTNKQSAVSLGLLPEVALELCKSVGNAAGTGARMALISQNLLEKTQWISRNVRHIELSTHPQFQELYIEHLRLKGKHL